MMCLWRTCFVDAGGLRRRCWTESRILYSRIMKRIAKTRKKRSIWRVKEGVMRETGGMERRGINFAEGVGERGWRRERRWREGV